VVAVCHAVHVCHAVIAATLSLCHAVTVPRCHCATLSLPPRCHCATLSLCHAVTAARPRDRAAPAPAPNVVRTHQDATVIVTNAADVTGRGARDAQSRGAGGPGRQRKKGGREPCHANTPEGRRFATPLVGPARVLQESCRCGIQKVPHAHALRCPRPAQKHGAGKMCPPGTADEADRMVLGRTCTSPSRKQFRV
jgi:hypothetical protein